MFPPVRRVMAYLSAGLLALLTIIVFSTLRYVGPESAVLRYHQAAIREDYQSIARLTYGPLETQESTWLVRGIRRAVNLSHSYYISRTVVARGLAEVQVIYARNNESESESLTFVLRQSNSGWRVSPPLTYEKKMRELLQAP